MMGGYYRQYGKTSYWVNRDRLNAIWYDEGWNIGYQAGNGELEKKSQYVSRVHFCISPLEW